MNLKNKHTTNEWRERALRFARTLKGRPRTQDEQEWSDQTNDPWEYFRVFGIQPETQKYIDKTVELLENLDFEGNYRGNAVTIYIRLKWSAKETKGLKHYEPSRRKDR